MYALPRGKYSAKVGKSACTPCSKGKYADSTGSISCILCPVNTVVSSIGLSVCSSCVTPNLARTKCLISGSNDNVDATDNPTPLPTFEPTYDPTFAPSSTADAPAPGPGPGPGPTPDADPAPDPAPGPDSDPGGAFLHSVLGRRLDSIDGVVNGFTGHGMLLGLEGYALVAPSHKWFEGQNHRMLQKCAVGYSSAPFLCIFSSKFGYL